MTYWACSAVLNLAAEDENKRRLGASGACEAVTSALTCFTDGRDVVYQACGAVANLAVHEESKRRLGASGAGAAFGSLWGMPGGCQLSDPKLETSQ